MNSTPQASHPAVLRVFQTKDQTRAFYNKISHVYDLLSERSEAPMRKAGLDLLKANAGESILEIGFWDRAYPRVSRQGGRTEREGVRTRFVRPDGEAGEGEFRPIRIA